MDPADVAIEITETERKLVGIWSEVLHIEQVPIDTTFLDFGTDSMLAAICAIRIWEVFNLELPETVLLEDGATIRALAAAIDRKAALLTGESVDELGHAREV